MKYLNLIPYKMKFYLAGLPSYFFPDAFFHFDWKNELEHLSHPVRQALHSRVEHYIRIKKPFTLSPMARNLSQLPIFNRSSYKIDLANVLRYVGKSQPFDVHLGDILNQSLPETPTFVKARPICEGNQNAVLLKLNSVRHFRFFPDPYSFREKSNKIFHRSKPHTLARRKVLERYHDNPNMDVGTTCKGHPHYRPFISPTEQMKNKFILCLEGIDIATSLKWVMASNSLCIMPKPIMESWFLESRLIPGLHYIECSSEVNDLEEVVQPYLDDPRRAEDMIRAAHEHLSPFRDLNLERIASCLVVEKYFQLARPHSA